MKFLTRYNKIIRIIILIEGIIWFALGNIALSIFLSIKQLPETISFLKSFFLSITVASLVLGVIFILFSIVMKRSQKNRALSDSLRKLLLTHDFEVPIMEFAYLNKITHEKAKVFIVRKAYKMFKNPKKNGILMLEKGTIYYFGLDRNGKPFYNLKKTREFQQPKKKNR